MCDKIEEGNPKYTDSRVFVEKSGCVGAHDALELCLKNNGKDWRQCQNEVADLGKCVRLASKSREIPEQRK